MVLPTIARDGKLAAGSTGISRRRPAPASGRPAWPWPSASRCRRCTICTMARSQPRCLTAVATMASNTGCTSVGELLMTRRMSALAVWCASASCVSLNSRTFSIAITAWSANVREQRHLLVRQRARLGGRHRDDADRRRRHARAAPRRSSGRPADRHARAHRGVAVGARVSASCSARHSSTARPTRLSRSIGITSAPWNSSSPE